MVTIIVATISNITGKQIIHQAQLIMPISLNVINKIVSNAENKVTIIFFPLNL